jgi:type II secretory pathway pseudopilin PulG
MELTIVIAVLVIASAVVVPSLTAVQRSRDLRKLEASIARLPVEARNEAVKSGKTVTVQISDNNLVMTEANTDGTARQIKQIALGNSISIEDAQQNGQAVAAETWQWKAYPDGTSDRGGLGIAEGSVHKYLLMQPDSNPVFAQGTLPDTTSDQWQAGDLLQRTGTS